MARTRQAAKAAPAADPEVKDANEVKSKRKAVSENESPIPRKLQKGTKKAVAKDGKTAKTVAAVEEDEEPAVEAETNSKQKDEAEVLAAEIDPEDESEAEPEDAVMYKTGQPVGTIPDVSQAVQKASKAKSDGETGVIYVGRVPHGFYEHEMRQYFAQFGAIKNLRLSRNKKTGASKHFAFIEFAEASTAEIVAKTMNNYLLFGHILKCHVIPKEQVHDDLFKGANKRFKKIPWNKLARAELEKPKTQAQWERKVAQETKSRSKKADKLKELLGYEFTPPALKAIPAPAALPETETETKAIEGATETAEETSKGDAETTKEDEAAPAEEQVEEEAKSISAPKTKAKAKGGKKTRKAKA